MGAHVVGDEDVTINIVNSERRQVIQKHADRFAILDVGNWTKTYLTCHSVSQSFEIIDMTAILEAPYWRGISMPYPWASLPWPKISRV